MLNLIPTGIEDCFEIQPQVNRDKRGSFVKIFVEDLFIKNGLEHRFVEDYYSCSKMNVLRGLNFQTTPHEHTKIVYCVDGHVTDVMLDLRVGSPTYLKWATTELKAINGNYLYIAKGVAHGFLVRSSTAIMVYKVSTSYAQSHDSGIRWDSAGIQWNSDEFIVSDRDKGFVEMKDFISPFKYNKKILINETHS